MAQYTARQDIIVCGLRAQRVNILSRQESLDVATWDDPLARLPMPTTHTVDFSFLYLREAEFDIAQQRFPVGSGTQFQGHDLGPADVCEMCGTAWLPGTLKCPMCAGRTNHAARAIEYAAKQAGRIIQTELTTSMTGPATFTVRAEFTALSWPAGGINEMFRHSLWREGPELWVCLFCGHMVHGYTAACPGCGGKRQPIAKLATQHRECLWCGAYMIGGYACPRCNMRLKAGIVAPPY
jgi:rubrerythrin